MSQTANLNAQCNEENAKGGLPPDKPVQSDGISSEQSVQTGEVGAHTGATEKPFPSDQETQNTAACVCSCVPEKEDDLHTACESLSSRGNDTTNALTQNIHVAESPAPPSSTPFSAAPPAPSQVQVAAAPSSAPSALENLSSRGKTTSSTETPVQNIQADESSAPASSTPSTAASLEPPQVQVAAASSSAPPAVLFRRTEVDGLTLTDWVTQRNADIVLIVCANPNSPVCQDILAFLKGCYGHWSSAEGGPPCVVVCNLDDPKNELRVELLDSMLSQEWIAVHNYKNASAIYALMRAAEHPGLPRMIVMKQNIKEMVDECADETLLSNCNLENTVRIWRGQPLQDGEDEEAGDEDNDDDEEGVRGSDDEDERVRAADLLATVKEENVDDSVV